MHCATTFFKKLPYLFVSLVRLKFRRGGRGRLPSAVGPRELFQVIEAMYRGKGKTGI